MSVYPHLRSAPIREALIDFRVRLPADFSQDSLRILADSLQAEFPKVGPIHQFQGQIEFGDDAPVAIQRGPQLIGYRLESPTGRNVAQIRIDGFTFSRLAPYKDWDRMVEGAWVVWERYLEGLRPLGIERVATRFINEIALPPSGQLAEVFSVPPGASDGRMESFLFRYQLAPIDGVTAIVSMATEDGAAASVILDIDCFVRRSFPTDTASLRAQLPKVREAKNRIFFTALTSRAIERFK